MEKSTLTETILSSYRNKLNSDDFETLFKLLKKLESESANTSSMAEKFNNLPEYKLLHEAFLREKAELTNNSASTIKIITVVYFICSIISALYLANKLL